MVQRNGPYDAAGADPARERNPLCPRTGCSRSSCRRRGSPTSASTPTGPTPAQPSQGEAVERAARVRRAPRRPGEEGAGSASRREPSRARPGSTSTAGTASARRTCSRRCGTRRPGPKLFGTFVELTNLVGALGFRDAVEALSSYRLVCVDEFELDDPGDTVLVSTLLDQAARGRRAAGRHLEHAARASSARAASRPPTSCARSRGWPPLRVGAHRRRGLPAPRPPRGARPRGRSTRSSERAAQPGASFDHFVDLTRHLADVHPSKYGALLDGVRGGLPRGRPHRRRPGGRAAARRAGRPDVRPRPAGRGQRRHVRRAVRRRSCSRAATARSTSGRSAASTRSPAKATGLERATAGHTPSMAKAKEPSSPSPVETLSVPPGPVDLTSTTRGHPRVHRRQGRRQGRAQRRSTRAVRPPGAAVRRGPHRLAAPGAAGAPGHGHLRQGRRAAAHASALFDPQGLRIKSFKAPTEEELAHDFLWRVEQRAARRPGSSASSTARTTRTC